MIAKDGNAVLECFKMNFKNATMAKSQKSYRRRSKYLANSHTLSRCTGRKKTHVLRFKQSQRKSKKPLPMDPDSLMGPTPLRFGHTAGTRDQRPTRCPLREIHGPQAKNCTCTHYTFTPTPLHDTIVISKPIPTPITKPKPKSNDKRIPITKLCLM
ncbi:hypothetical protein RNJ44_02804 [Nakaseomyces bracarensis]|uniref:Uncharacterized protein n=1 Tax=Nakaseomyces bracarensis TaxID=273131 RepID=A0ABR4P0C2_9SACH